MCSHAQGIFAFLMTFSSLWQVDPQDIVMVCMLCGIHQPLRHAYFKNFVLKEHYS